MATRGQRRHRITLRNPGAVVPDGEGGFTQVPAYIGTRYAEIKPATARDLERVTAGTVQSSASHVITADYHPGVTTKTQVVFGARVFEVAGVANPEERNVDMILICSEVVA